MTDLPAGHKPKMKSSSEIRSPSSKKLQVQDSQPVISKLDLSGNVGMTFEVRVLVWEQLQQKLNVVEWEEAKSILGENTIDENEALKEENLALLSIWKDFSQSTNSIEERCQDVTKASKSPLPEPPHVRDLLFKQIKFFIDELPTRSKREIVASTTPRERAVYDYVTRGTLPSRPSTASSSRDKPIDTRPNSARSSGSATPPSPGSPHDAQIDSETDAARNLLRAHARTDLDIVQAHAIQLKALLVQEHELLLKDAEFLQFCLEQQADYNSQLQKFTKEKQDSAVPSLQEMREFNSKLEQKYLETSHGSEKEKERRSSSSRPRTSSLPDQTPSKSSSRPHLPSSSTPPPRPRASVSEKNISADTRGSEHHVHIPHPPKEHRPADARPRAKLANVTLSPSILNSHVPSALSPSHTPSAPLSLPPVSPPSPSSLPLISPSLPVNASPKRTRLKQT